MSRVSGRADLRSWGWLGTVLCAGILALGFSVGALASGPPADREDLMLVWPSKALYFDGLAYEFRSEWYSSGKYDLILYAFDDTQQKWQKSLTSEAIGGGLGAVSYGEALYCFFTNTSGALQYMKVDIPALTVSGPVTVASGVGSSGAAAAVVDGTLYVLVAPSYGFQSSDGVNFTTWTPQFSQAPPARMLAAITMYPLGDDPASILFVYYDNASPANLSSCWISPPGLTAPLHETTLPYSSSLKPVMDGGMILGTWAPLGPNPVGGAKAPCVQFYGLTDMGDDSINHQMRWEYNLQDLSWTMSDVTQVDVGLYLFVYPWPVTIEANGTMQMQQVMGVLSSQGSYDAFYTFQSDWMVPQIDDPQYGWQGTPTNTADAPPGDELRNLWTLVGVVLGPAPFPMNGAPNACADAEDVYSCVTYGQGTSSTITGTTTSSAKITIASDTKIKGGIGELDFDLSYARAWTSSHSSSTTTGVFQSLTMGPCSETPPDQGITGWVVFNAPTLVTQQYKLYAYDYELGAQQGTYLNQDVYATALGGAVQQTAYYTLQDPSQGEYPDLLTGMPLYPNSSDPAAWYSSVQSWSASSDDWDVLIGSGTSPAIAPLNLGIGNTVSYTQSQVNITSKTNSSSFSVKAGAEIDILGFSEGVTVGYDGKWTTETENESEITSDVTCTYGVPRPPDGNPSYVSSLTVQPYWLQATSAKAPWLPTAFGANLPWCITWNVTGIAYESGAAAGYAGHPHSALGTIRHGGENDKNTYELAGGRLAWVDADGMETPIPISADDFQASPLASLSLNGHVFSADGAKGKWTRSGDVWSYKTKAGAKGDRFTLGLDFGSGSWSLDLSSKTLDEELRAADGGVKIALSVQGMYGFQTWLGHDVNASWKHKEKKSAWPPSGVHELEGAYDSQSGVGALTLKGHIPKDTPEFGDVEIRVNGASARFPILSAAGFLNALRSGGKVSYQADGLAFEMDFGKGQWEAAIQGEAFEPGMAPKSGAAEVQVFVGGKPLSSQSFVIQKCTTALRYTG